MIEKPAKTDKDTIISIQTETILEQNENINDLKSILSDLNANEQKVKELSSKS